MSGNLHAPALERKPPFPVIHWIGGQALDTAEKRKNLALTETDPGPSSAQMNQLVFCTLVSAISASSCNASRISLLFSDVSQTWPLGLLVKPRETVCNSVAAETYEHVLYLAVQDFLVSIPSNNSYKSL